MNSEVSRSYPAAREPRWISTVIDPLIIKLYESAIYLYNQVLFINYRSVKAKRKQFFSTLCSDNRRFFSLLVQYVYFVRNRDTLCR